MDPDDNYLRAAAAAGRGIRILRQDPWEMIITFVISQQKTIPCIRRLVEDISRRWGQKIADGDDKNSAVYSFPTPKELARASLEELLDLKLGYRAKYIHRLSQDAAAGTLDLKKLETMEYGQAMEYLTGFYGIGKKVANCVCLFGLHHSGGPFREVRRLCRRAPAVHILLRAAESTQNLALTQPVK